MSLASNLGADASCDALFPSWAFWQGGPVVPVFQVRAVPSCPGPGCVQPMDLGPEIPAGVVATCSHAAIELFWQAMYRNTERQLGMAMQVSRCGRHCCPQTTTFVDGTRRRSGRPAEASGLL